MTYSTVNHQLVNEFQFLKDPNLRLQYNPTKLERNGTQIGFLKELSGKYIRLHYKDKWFRSRESKQIHRFGNMIRFLFPITSRSERNTLYYYCGKFDKQYKYNSDIIFYLALLQLKRFNPTEAYKLYPFGAMATKKTCFRIAAMLGLFPIINFQQKYLMEILQLGGDRLEEREKFIMFYNWAYPKLVHSRPSLRIAICLRFFYPSGVYLEIIKQFSHATLLSQKTAVYYLKTHFRSLFYRLSEKSREIRSQ